MNDQAQFLLEGLLFSPFHLLNEFVSSVSDKDFSSSHSHFPHLSFLHRVHATLAGCVVMMGEVGVGKSSLAEKACGVQGLSSTSNDELLSPDTNDAAGEPPNPPVSVPVRNLNVFKKEREL